MTEAFGLTFLVHPACTEKIHCCSRQSGQFWQSLATCWISSDALMTPSLCRLIVSLLAIRLRYVLETWSWHVAVKQRKVCINIHETLVPSYEVRTNNSSHHSLGVSFSSQNKPPVYYCPKTPSTVIDRSWNDRPGTSTSGSETTCAVSGTTTTTPETTAPGITTRTTAPGTRRTLPLHHLELQRGAISTAPGTTATAPDAGECRTPSVVVVVS